jgi:hypothetical protein
MSSRQCFRQDRLIDGHRSYNLRTKMADGGVPPEFEQVQKYMSVMW